MLTIAVGSSSNADRMRQFPASPSRTIPQESGSHLAGSCRNWCTQIDDEQAVAAQHLMLGALFGQKTGVVR